MNQTTREKIEKLRDLYQQIAMIEEDIAALLEDEDDSDDEGTEEWEEEQVEEDSDEEDEDIEDEEEDEDEEAELTQKRTGRPVSGKLCSIDGCGKAHVAKGWCSAHYARFKYQSTKEQSIRSDDAPDRVSSLSVDDEDDEQTDEDYFCAPCRYQFRGGIKNGQKKPCPICKSRAVQPAF